MLLDPTQITRGYVFCRWHDFRNTLLLHFSSSLYARKGTRYEENEKRRRKDRTTFFSVTFLLKQCAPRGEWNISYPRFPILEAFHHPWRCSNDPLLVKNTGNAYHNDAPRNALVVHLSSSSDIRLNHDRGIPSRTWIEFISLLLDIFAANTPSPRLPPPSLERREMVQASQGSVKNSGKEKSVRRHSAKWRCMPAIKCPFIPYGILSPTWWGWHLTVVRRLWKIFEMKRNRVMRNNVKKLGCARPPSGKIRYQRRWIIKYYSTFPPDHENHYTVS